MRDLSQKAQILGLISMADESLAGSVVSQGVTIANVCTLIERSWLALFSNIPAYRDYVFAVKRGSTQVHLGNDDIFDVLVPLPPLAEQKRIVAKIETTTAKIEIIEKAADEAEKLLQKYRESILAKAFRGELVPQDPSEGTGHDLLARIRAESNEATTSKKKASSPQEASDAVSLDIPKSWGLVAFIEVVSDSTSSQKLLSSEIQSSGSYPVIDQGQGFIAGYTEKAHLLRSFDSPVIIFGDHTRQFKYVDFPFVQGADGTKVLTMNDCFFVKFAFYFFRSLKIPSHGYSRHFKFLKLASIPLPPLSEQERIVAAIEKHESIAEVLQTNINVLKAQAKKLRESILASAFSGKLVRQDPSEGTGHELLEQIRAATTAPDSEDATEATPKKPRKKRSKK